jgi:hypothetical protein
MTAAAPERRTPGQKISGLIERVTFFNEDNGFCVLRVRAKGHREDATVIGSAPAVNAGETRPRRPDAEALFGAPGEFGRQGAGGVS